MHSKVESIYFSALPTMLRSIVWLGYASAALGQFDFKHTQYETSPPVYPSRKSGS